MHNDFQPHPYHDGMIPKSALLKTGETVLFFAESEMALRFGNAIDAIEPSILISFPDPNDQNVTHTRVLPWNKFMVSDRLRIEKDVVISIGDMREDIAEFFRAYVKERAAMKHHIYLGRKLHEQMRLDDQKIMSLLESVTPHPVTFVDEPNDTIPT